MFESAVLWDAVTGVVKRIPREQTRLALSPVTIGLRTAAKIIPLLGGVYTITM
jgi:hypothetical protein